MKRNSTTRNISWLLCWALSLVWWLGSLSFAGELAEEIQQITNRPAEIKDYTTINRHPLNIWSSSHQKNPDSILTFEQADALRQICNNNASSSPRSSGPSLSLPSQPIQQFQQQERGLSWDWSPPAKWHAQVVKIHNSFNGNRGYGYKLGSGVYVRYKGISGILTAAHVMQTNVNERPRIHWSDGKITHAFTHHVTWDRNYRPGSDTVPSVWDSAWIHAHHPTIEPLELTTAIKGPVEMNGHGGKGESHRHWWGTTELIDSNLVAISKMSGLYGDSGGPWIQKGKVVAISSGIAVDREVDTDRGRLPVGTMTVATPVQAVAPFLDRVSQIAGFM